MIDRRRALLTNRRGKLPAEYQEIEWVGSGGNPYIDTNWFYKPNSIVEIAFARDVSGDSVFFGNIKTSDMCGFGCSNGRNPYICVGSTYAVFSSISIDVNFHKYKGIWYDDGYDFYLDDNLLTSSKSYKSQTPHDSSCFLFGYKNNSGGKGSTTKAHKIKNCIIAEENEENIVRNFIPCYMKSDGVIGMYDLCGSICQVTGTPFYVNTGIGTFTKGSDVN